MKTTVQLVDYPTHRNILHQIRSAVFVEEQGVPADIEVDRWDPLCIHALAFCQGRPAGTGRLLPDGHIGRVAVLPSMRHRGVGTRIMRRLLQVASHHGYEQVEISAQCHAIAFYRRLGFREEGLAYQEAGIKHVKMVKSLPTPLVWRPTSDWLYVPSIGAARLS